MEGDNEEDVEEEKEEKEAMEEQGDLQAQSEGVNKGEDGKHEGEHKDEESDKGNEKEGENEGQESATSVSAEEMDHLLWISALQACKSKVRPKALPLLANTFYSEYLLKSRPVNTTLDFKQSSYKKLLPFLRHLEAQGVLKLAEPSEGVFQITDVNRSHRDLREYEGHDVHEEDDIEDEGDVSDKIEPVSAIVEVWKLPSPLLFLLQQEDPECVSH